LEGNDGHDDFDNDAHHSIVSDGVHSIRSKNMAQVVLIIHQVEAKALVKLHRSDEFLLVSRGCNQLFFYVKLVGEDGDDKKLDDDGPDFAPVVSPLLLHRHGEQ
jgi:hypothetical protein